MNDWYLHLPPSPQPPITRIDFLGDCDGKVYSVAYWRDTYADGGEHWVAVCPELPGCMTDGATPSEAVANLNGAREDYIASLIEDGLPVPLPGSHRTVTR